VAEEQITEETPLHTPGDLGVDQASYDKYYKEGNFDWQSYSKELEYKYSQVTTKTEETPQATPEGEEIPSVAAAQNAVENAGLNWEDLSQRIGAEGDLSDEDYDALTNAGIPPEISRNYVRMARADVENTVADVISKFGGNEGFEQVYNALQENTTVEIRNQIDLLLRDSVTRDAGVAMSYQYSGIQPNTTTPVPPPTPTPVASRGNAGAAPSSAPQGFVDMEQMSAAMQDPRYRTDSTYRAEVEARARAASFDFNPRRHTSGL